jgi:hypothetical protein
MCELMKEKSGADCRGMNNCYYLRSEEHIVLAEMKI